MISNGCRVLKNNIHAFMNEIANKPDVFYKFCADFTITDLTRMKENSLIRKETENKESFAVLEKLLSGRDISLDSEQPIKEILYLLPNDIHPVVKQEKISKIIKVVGEKKSDICTLSYDLLRDKDLLRTSNLLKYCGERSYYFIRDLAKLEWALIEYSLKRLLMKGFKLISVPDILNSQIIESCGMTTSGTRTQVYKLDTKKYGLGWCLSGTAEMGLAAYVMDKDISIERIPLHLSSVSRCYRAEISHLATEKGLYRVHQFTKVEMFSICLPSQSTMMLESFRKFQESTLNVLDLHYHVIDMGPHDLGRQAYRKYDIEVWMSGYNKYGEISSCSNCTDYQARRLNIRSRNIFLHTLNATACAVPRTIIAITETFPMDKGRVHIPEALQSYMGTDILGKKRGPRLSPVKSIPKRMMNEFIL